MWRFVVLLILVGACTESPAPSQKTSVTEEKILALGDSLTLEATQVLMQNLLHAQKTYGWRGAVHYCSEKALSLTDSLSKTWGITLARRAHKNRNPANALQEEDLRAYTAFAESLSRGTTPAPMVYAQEEKVLYFKPILVMPTCLKCHGQEKDLDPLALAEIRKRYPADKATGFSPGQLRGIWRVEIPKSLVQ
ncbi:MAG: Tll0287-like domain-containing protein [Bacteroidia bacterium]